MSGSLDDSDEEFDQLQSGSMDSELEKVVTFFTKIHKHIPKAKIHKFGVINEFGLNFG